MPFSLGVTVNSATYHPNMAKQIVFRLHLSRPTQDLLPDDLLLLRGLSLLLYQLEIPANVPVDISSFALSRS